MLQGAQLATGRTDVICSGRSRLTIEVIEQTDVSNQGCIKLQLTWFPSPPSHFSTWFHSSLPLPFFPTWFSSQTAWFYCTPGGGGVNFIRPWSRQKVYHWMRWKKVAKKWRILWGNKVCDKIVTQLAGQRYKTAHAHLIKADGAPGIRTYFKNQMCTKNIFFYPPFCLLRSGKSLNIRFFLSRYCKRFP